MTPPPSIHFVAGFLQELIFVPVSNHVTVVSLPATHTWHPRIRTLHQRPGVPAPHGIFLFTLILVPSSVLAPSSKARSP